MESITNEPILFCCILEIGKGTKMLKMSKELGIAGGTICLGRGAVRSEWLNKLGILETRKEIVFTIIDGKSEDLIYEKVSDKFSLEKLHHGIAFSIPLKYFLKIDGSKYISNNEKEGVGSMDYESIFVIAGKDSLDDILEAAEEAGSTGGTIIHGRGSGTQEKAKLFNIEIEPEKIIVLILSKIEKTDSIVKSIKERLNIHEPSTGIIFVMDVSRAKGLYR